MDKLNDIVYIKKSMVSIDVLSLSTIDNKFYQHLLFDGYLHEENGTNFLNQIYTFNLKLLDYKKICWNKSVKPRSISSNENFNKLDRLTPFIKIYGKFIDLVRYEDITYQINILNYDNCITLSSGYVNSKGGHAILMYIKKSTNTNTYELYLFNSGEGINNHTNDKNKDDNNIGIKFKDISYDNIIKIIKFNYIFLYNSDNKNLKYIKNELENKNQGNRNKGNNKKIYSPDEYINIDNYYKLLYKYVDRGKMEVILKDDPQLSGSCTFYSQFYFIKWYFKEYDLDFDDFYNFIKKDAIDFISKYTGDNENILTLLFLLKKDYNKNININNTKLLNNINNIIKKKTIISHKINIVPTIDMGIYDYEVIIRNMEDNDYNKDIKNFLDNFYSECKTKNFLSNYFMMNYALYYFYNKICDFFIVNPFSPDHIKMD